MAWRNAGQKNGQFIAATSYNITDVEDLTNTNYMYHKDMVMGTRKHRFGVVEFKKGKKTFTMVIHTVFVSNRYTEAFHRQNSISVFPEEFAKLLKFFNSTELDSVMNNIMGVTENEEGSDEPDAKKAKCD